MSTSQFATVAAALEFTACAKPEFLDNSDKSKSTFNPSDPSSQYSFINPAAAQPANDGVVLQGNNFVEIVSNPFTLTQSKTEGPCRVLEHVKNLRLQKTAWNLQSDNTAIYTLRLSTQALGTAIQPFSAIDVTDVRDDLRLASCGLISTDLRNAIVAGFYATNTGLWAYHERLPRRSFARTATSNYLDFSRSKRVGNREPHTYAAPFAWNTSDEPGC
jgi:Family of unknown function (DUF6081)